jgi:hypothetical protein
VFKSGAKSAAASANRVRLSGFQSVSLLRLQLSIRSKTACFDFASDYFNEQHSVLRGSEENSSSSLKLTVVNVCYAGLSAVFAVASWVCQGMSQQKKTGGRWDWSDSVKFAG